MYDDEDDESFGRKVNLLEDGKTPAAKHPGPILLLTLHNYYDITTKHFHIRMYVHMYY